jgi:hypothetical protein
MLLRHAMACSTLYSPMVCRMDLAKEKTCRTRLIALILVGHFDNGIGIKARFVVPYVVATPRDRPAIAAACA